MDDLQKVTEHVEYLFLGQIIKGLENKTMTPDQVQQFAKDYLPIEPFQTLDDAKAKVAQYVASHEEFRPLQDYVDAFHGDTHANEKIAQMKSLIQENKIDEAIQVAQQ
jgi:hypothetical protein